MSVGTLLHPVYGVVATQSGDAAARTAAVNGRTVRALGRPQNDPTAIQVPLEETRAAPAHSILRSYRLVIKQKDIELSPKGPGQKQLGLKVQD